MGGWAVDPILMVTGMPLPLGRWTFEGENLSDENPENLSRKIWSSNESRALKLHNCSASNIIYKIVKMPHIVYVYINTNYTILTIPLVPNTTPNRLIHSQLIPGRSSGIKSSPEAHDEVHPCHRLLAQSPDVRSLRRFDFFWGKKHGWRNDGIIFTGWWMTVVWFQN